MDDEDRSDIGFAPKVVSATDQFALTEKKPAVAAKTGVFAGAEMPELVVSVQRPFHACFFFFFFFLFVFFFFFFFSRSFGACFGCHYYL
jgi:hypothetical protein